MYMLLLTTLLMKELRYKPFCNLSTSDLPCTLDLSCGGFCVLSFFLVFVLGFSFGGEGLRVKPAHLRILVVDILGIGRDI